MIRVTPDDGLRISYSSFQEALDCLRDLRMYKALLLLRRRSLEQLIARVDGATLELTAKTRKPPATLTLAEGERRAVVTAESEGLPSAELIPLRDLLGP